MSGFKCVSVSTIKGALLSFAVSLRYLTLFRLLCNHSPRMLQYIAPLLASQSDAHTIAPHRDPTHPNPNPSHTQSTYSSGARKTHDVIYFEKEIVQGPQKQCSQVKTRT